MKRFFAFTAVAALLASFLLFDTQCIINNENPTEGNTSTDKTTDTTTAVDTTTDSTGDTTTVVDTTTTDTSSHVSAQDTGIIYTLTGGGGFSCLAIDEQHNMYTVWSNGLETHLWRITSSGTRSVFSDSSKIKALGAINCLYWDTAGNKLLAIVNDSAIVEFSAGGDPSAIYTGGKDLGFNHAENMLKDAAGNWYASNLMGLNQKIFKITAAGVGSLLLQPADPTGIGAMAINQDGDLIYVSNGLFKLPSGGTTEQPLFPDLGNSIKAAYEAANGAIPAGAIQTKFKVDVYSFGQDAAGNIYTEGKVEYTVGSYPDFTTTTSRHLMKITPAGVVTFVETMDTTFHSAAYYQCRGEYLYSIRYIKTGGWSYSTNIYRRRL